MKVLVLNYEYPPLGGGAAPVSREISTQLCEKGYDVTVITMGFNKLPTYEEVQGVKIYRLPCLRKRKNVCKPWEQYTYLLAVRHFLKTHMVGHSYDVCHVHFVVPTGEVARWIKKKYQIPYIITAHGSDVEGHNTKMSMKLMHRVLRKSWRKIINDAYAVIAPSAYLKKLMIHNYPCNKYQYIPNGLEFEKWHNCAATEDKCKRILIMGRLQKFKNVQMILYALENVDLGEWRVDILGDGPYKKELEQIATKLGLKERINFHGWIDNGTDDQLGFVKTASVYISASQFENCPMSVIEAVAAGCYPLLSDIPAHRQLLESDEYYFNLGDIQGLSEKIRAAISDNGLRNKEKIDVSRYDWKNIISQYDDILKKASETL